MKEQLTYGHYYSKLDCESLDEMLGSYSDVSNNPNKVKLWGHKSIREAVHQAKSSAQGEPSPLTFEIYNHKLEIVKIIEVG